MAFIIGRTDGDLDFDSLVVQLRNAFPDSSVISDDYYRNRIERQKMIAKSIAIEDDCAPIRCTERLALEHGIQRHLAVFVCQDVSFDARIDRFGILAVGGNDKVECRDAAQRLIEILRTYNLEIETSWNDVN